MSLSPSDSRTVQTGGVYCASRIYAVCAFPNSYTSSTSVTVAIDAMHSASNPHAFMGVTEQGLAAIVKTRGNKDVHVILRGGTRGPNFATEHIRKAVEDIEKKAKKSAEEKPFASIMVDCSRMFTFSFLLSRFSLFLFHFPFYFHFPSFPNLSVTRWQFVQKPPQPTPRHCQHLRAARCRREEYHRRDDRVAHQRGPPGRAPSWPVRTQTRRQHHRRLRRLGEHG